MEGFIRGGDNGGEEVDLMAILPDSLRAYSNQEKQEAFAASVEKRDSVFVIRPWESHEYLSRLDPDARAAAENEIRIRRERIVAIRASKAAGEKFGMSPQAAEKELKALLREWSPTHPDPKRRANIEVEIHKLQTILGVPHKDFSQANAVRIDGQKKELSAKLAQYGGQDKKNRKKIIDGLKNVDLLKLIRDTEPEPELQTMAVARVTELELTA